MKGSDLIRILLNINEDWEIFTTKGTKVTLIHQPTGTLIRIDEVAQIPDDDAARVLKMLE